ncbi:MAG: heavy-metal-associated domain-containing protein [Candidatus Methylomirabilales bacterium]
MSLEVTLRVNGLDCSRNGSSNLAERLVNFLEAIEGILGAHHDRESGRFAVRYDPNRITLLRILSRIEFMGRETGYTYRPTDVKTNLGVGGSIASDIPESAPRPLRVTDPAGLAIS